MNKDIEVPYFFTNTDWYYYDEKEGIYKLTELATQEAIDSYNEFYAMVNDEIEG